MPLYCQGLNGKGCPWNTRVKKASTTCRKCKPRHKGRPHGGARTCHVYGCGNGVRGVVKPPQLLASPHDVLTGFAFCATCKAVIKEDVNKTALAAAKGKIFAHLATHDQAFMIGIRR